MCNSERRSSLTDEAASAAKSKVITPQRTAEVKARIAQLSAMGFDRLDALDTSKLDSDVTELILLEANMAYWFDVETGQFPNQHDSLMRSLAALVSPVLDDAVFEEEYPPEIDDDSHPYQLIAYADGNRYRVEARNLGDWYDVDAVLRFMNAIMESRGARARFVSLATTDQMLIVVAAPQDALAKAAEAGLLELGDAAAAEQIGKEYEDKVLRELQHQKK
ncbi:MAG: hypothetical protein LBE24_09220 [Methylobacillus sp.]|jgi:hypothetical protein|nr:hypothetical protein [Methylobacillus sp.]